MLQIDAEFTDRYVASKDRPDSFGSGDNEGSRGKSVDQATVGFAIRLDKSVIGKSIVRS